MPKPDDSGVVYFQVPLPKSWAKALKQAATDANAQSTVEFLRQLVDVPAVRDAAANLKLELPALSKSGKWGGRRQAIYHPELRNHLRTVPRLPRKSPQRKGIVWDIQKPADWDDENE